MPSLSVRLDADDLARLNRRLSKLLHDTLNLEPVWREAAEYMKMSTQNRILRTKTAPDGERWAALSDVTIELKGHDSQLFQSGEMAGSVDVLDVSNDGFMITTDAPYASYMHKGVSRVKGAFKSKRPAPQIPARPFMGFSDENVRRISKMVRDYLANGGD
jgi:phage virion morphogenesis protein